jgi:hypothetical protein
VSPVEKCIPALSSPRLSKFKDVSRRSNLFQAYLMLQPVSKHVPMEEALILKYIEVIQ